MRHGIYAMRVDHDGRRYPAAGYVGARPTFGEGEPVLEAYLLDFAGDLYGEEVEVEFIAFLRPDQTFADAGGACRSRCARIASAARAVLAKIEPTIRCAAFRWPARWPSR